MARLLRSSTIAIAVLFSLLVQFAQPAHAATATWNSGPEAPYSDCDRFPSPVIRFRASPGEANRVTLVHERVAYSTGADPGWTHCGENFPFAFHNARVVITDAGAPVNVAGSGCKSGPVGAVTCQNARVEVFLGDRNDLFTETNAIPFAGAWIDAGSGDDTIRVVNAAKDNVICGPGLDTVVADARDWVDASCEKVTLVP